MIWPILEARAEMQKYFNLFFGSNENFKICFRDQLAFSNDTAGKYNGARTAWIGTSMVDYGHNDEYLIPNIHFEVQIVFNNY